MGEGEVGTCTDVWWNGFGVVWCMIRTQRGSIQKRSADVVAILADE
jgi:hypothetical protein